MNDEDAQSVATSLTAHGNTLELIGEILSVLEERLVVVERTLVANNIHPPMPGYPSPADKEA